MNPDKYSTCRRENSWSPNTVSKSNGARFPASWSTPQGWFGVTASSQYGPDFLALLAYLNTQQFISLARIDQMSAVKK